MPRRLLVFATLASTAACAPPPAGVHVVVTMEDSEFSGEHTFDHLTVVARVGERVAGACLYPADAVVRERALDDPAPHACADLREQPWTGPPTAATWALADNPREINVEAAGGELVEVEVTGGFGGRLGTMTGAGEQVASADYPELHIELRRGVPVFEEGCELRLEPSFPDEFDTKYRLCEALEVKCPEKVPYLLRSPAVTCVGEMSRLRNAPGVTCDQAEGSPTVWRTPPVPSIDGKSGCVRIFASARFARCREGDPGDPQGCPLTTDCTTAGARVWTRDGGVNGATLSDVTMSCAPPTTLPVTWSLVVKDTIGDVVVGISQSVEAAAEGACFLDVESITATSVDCTP